MKLCLLVLVSAFVTGCGSSSSSPAASSGDVPADAGVDAADAAIAIPACEGTTTDGILGAFSANALAGGDGPNGIVNVKTSYFFCGTTASGTTRFTEDGPGFGGVGCKLVTDIRGTFTFDGTKLVITNKSGFRSLRGCASGTDQAGTLEAPDTRAYQATATATELTLTSLDPNGGSPETFQRQ